MNTKTLIAYESKSSTTIRLTPVEVGRLVSMIPDDKLDQLVQSIVEQSVFMTDERRQVLSNKLVQCTKKINGDFR